MDNPKNPFACTICDKVCDDDFALISHLRQFHPKRHHTVYCPSGCETTFVTVPALVTHYYREHHYKRPKVFLTPSTSIEAPLAVVDPSQDHQSSTAAAALDTDQELVSHLEDVAPVPVVDQDQEFHGPTIAVGSDQLQEEEISSDHSDIELEDMEPGGGDDDVVEVLDFEEGNKAGCEKTVNPIAEELVLYLRRKHAVPQNVVQEVIQLTRKLVVHEVREVCSKVRETLKGSKINVDFKTLIDSATTIFRGLETKKQQDSTFMKSLKIVKPRKVFIGRTLRKKRVRSGKFKGRQTTAVENHVVFNSLKQFLEKLVTHPDFEKITDPSGIDPDPNVLDSFVKGEKFKTSLFFKKHPDALRLKPYFDEYDSCDSLASKAGKHKAGAFHVEVDNILPQYRSNLDTISNTANVNNNLLKDVGMNIVLKPMLEELQELEKGVTLANGKVIYASLIGVMGDNLGVHSLCGMKQGFTATRTCQHCMADQNGIHTMVKEDITILRTEHQYEHQISQMKTAVTKKRKEELSKDFGLNHECSLNQLETFHVTSGIVADPMHDLLEGILPMQMKKLLHHLTSGNNPVVTLDWLNSMLEDFDYEYSEICDKPSFIRASHINDKDGKLHQSSAQTWFLATHLPSILGPHVPEDDPHWCNFLQIVEISRIVFSPSVPKFIASYLDDLIEDYLTKFIELYGDLIPKQHFLVHYARLLLLFGPLYLWSCMRMEALHRWFKREAYSIGNYTNLIVSLSCKYALHQALALSKSLIRDHQHGPLQEVLLKNTDYGKLIPGVEKAVEAKWLKLSTSALFIPARCLIVVDIDSGFEPQFVEVEHILLRPRTLLVCREFKTLRHDPQADCYVVQQSTKLVIVKPESMLGHTVFHKHTIDGRTVVVMKYTINGCF